MERDQEKKHRCKVCRKSFPSGRSLGGHMRSHVAMNSLEDGDEKMEKKSSFFGGANGYGLRENPKKTWRLSDAIDGEPSEKPCRECGKCFPSWKALFGHMRCHSSKSSSSHALDGEQDEHEASWSGVLSDNEVSGLMVPTRKRRSRRSSAAAAASSSSATEREEQEDVAMILMMLSRDTGHWGGSESSDKYSAVAERIDSDEIEIDYKGKKVAFDAERSKLAAAGGVLRSGIKIVVESDVSDNGFMDESKKAKLYPSDSDNDSYEESGKKVKLEQCDSRKLASFDDYSPSFRLDASPSEKRSRYECTTCNKSFHSYQALGGHRAGHKRYPGGCSGFRLESIDNNANSLDTDASMNRTVMEEVSHRNAGIDAGFVPATKAKAHECPICGKCFPSGQALGGHKRSHLASSSDAGGSGGSGGDGGASCYQTVLIQQQNPVMPDLLDLNLPAPVEEDAKFKPWLKYEAMVGLISN